MVGYGIDFCRFPPTAATVSSSLLLGICGLPDTKFKVGLEFGESVFFFGNGGIADLWRVLLFNAERN